MKTKKLLLLLTTVAMLVASCRVMLIGAYDQVTDEGIQKIQTDVSGLLITLKKNLVNNEGASNDYKNFGTTYNTIEAEIQSLNIRTKALPKYSIITSQIGTLNKNVLDLEAQHKGGQFAMPKDTLILNLDLSAFEVQFTSMTALQNGLKLEKTN